MVVFTCNHCGESVKKPSVEKHYNTKCSQAPVFVSCMDCLKDFRDQEYVAHTRCITEAEKYSGKDFVPKQSKNTGLKKQESWLEIVRTILTTTDYEVTPAVRGVFQKLQGYENVPRKRAKFQNFVQNCMRIRNDVAAAVWDVLEIALNKFNESRKKQQSTESPPEIENKSDDMDVSSKMESTEIENNDETLTNGHSTDIKDDSAIKKKKKKKHKELNSTEDQNLENSIANENSNTIEEIPSNIEVKEKKSKKRKNKEIADMVEGMNGAEECEVSPKKTNKSDETEVSKEPVKKKKKSKSIVNEIVEPEIVDETIEEVKPKKKKKKNDSVNEIVESERVDVNGIVEPEIVDETIEEAKPKKEKKKNDSVNETTIDDATEEPMNGDESLIVHVSNTPKPKKEKKAKKKDQQFEEPVKTELNGNSCNGVAESAKVKWKRIRSKEYLLFDWNAAIIKTLTKHNNEISLDLLKKKVFKKYMSAANKTECVNKVEKTFNKRLRKSGLLIENDIVKFTAK